METSKSDAEHFSIFYESWDYGVNDLVLELSLPKVIMIIFVKYYQTTCSMLVLCHINVYLVTRISVEYLFP